MLESMLGGKSSWGKIYMGYMLVLQTESEGWEISNKLNNLYDFLLLRIYP